MSYTGQTPDTRRATDWRDSAACRDEDAELWFASDLTGPGARDVQQAKAICGRCPSADACLTFALNENIGDGIYGGLNEKERASLRRSIRRGRTGAEDVEAKANEARSPQRERTLKTIVEDNTAPLPGGHLAWTGAQKPGFNGQVYTPKQLCFTADRGHPPAGRLRAECGIDECVLPAHLVEVPVEAECGTRGGYRKHKREETEVCTPCRRANSDADARLRRTGTTKVLAS